MNKGIAFLILKLFVENTDYSEDNIAVIEPTDFKNEFNVITDDGFIWYVNIKELEFRKIGIYNI